MRPWLSGITSPCQGLVGVSITPGRTQRDARKGVFSYVRPGERCLRTFLGNRNCRNGVFSPFLRQNASEARPAFL